MNYFRFTIVLAILVTLAAGCNKTTYRKTPGGMAYRVFPGKDTTRIQQRMILKLTFTQKVNDSVYFTNVDKPPFYSPVPREPMPYDISEIWPTLNVGDSIITVQSMDTFMRRNPGGLPPHFRKGDRITTYVKVLAAFTNPTEAVNDEKMEKEKYQQKEIAQVEKYLKDKKIEAVRTPSGAFIEIIDEGAGPAVDSGKFVYVNYTGTSFSGTRFDSNTDTSFHHAEPYGYTAASGEMIKGFDEAVMFLNKGGKGKAYIPSTLAYGGNPGSALIKPFEHLIFDIEVVDVLAARPAPPAPRGNAQRGSGAPQK